MEESIELNMQNDEIDEGEEQITENLFANSIR